MRRPGENSNLENFARDVLFEILRYRFGIFRLLTRGERLIYRTKFTLRDPTDEPHVVAALVSECDGIVTFDSHFDAVKDTIAVYTPGALIAFLDNTLSEV